MKFAHMLCLTAVMLVGVVFSAFATTEGANAQDDKIQWMEIKKPSVLRKERGSRAEGNTIRMTKTGEYLEILTCGEDWCKVRDTLTKTDGFVEKNTGKIVSKQGTSFVTLIVYVILLLGSAAAVITYVRKQL